MTVPPIAGGDDGEFVLRVKGDSMKNAGIFEDDYVVVRPQKTATNGEIVVAMLDGEATVKRFFKEKDARAPAAGERRPRADLRARRGHRRPGGRCLPEGLVTPAVLDRPAPLFAEREAGAVGGGRVTLEERLDCGAPRGAHERQHRVPSVPRAHGAHAGRRRVRRLRQPPELGPAVPSPGPGRPRRRPGSRPSRWGTWAAISEMLCSPLELPSPGLYAALLGASLRASTARAFGPRIDRCRPSSRGEVGEKTGPSRKVRTPQGRVVGGPTRRKPRESATETNRLSAGPHVSPVPARVKRCGKSAPASR